MTRRVSPLNMRMGPDGVTRRDGWEIPLTYVGEKTSHSPFIVDLSHVPKWALQGRGLDDMRPAGFILPPKPGEVTFERRTLITRLTPRECHIMALGDEIPRFEGPQYTDVTDAFASFAVVGARCMEILNKLSSVDLEVPGRAVPRAAQAPIEDVTSLIIRLEGENNTPGLIVSVARGYGHFFLDIFMDAGKEFHVAVAGWERFAGWLWPGK
ncbi:MAG: hypothetical protein V1930_08270 [Pseudomonadota bacterium]